MRLVRLVLVPVLGACALDTSGVGDGDGDSTASSGPSGTSMASAETGPGSATASTSGATGDTTGGPGTTTASSGPDTDATSNSATDDTGVAGWGPFGQAVPLEGVNEELADDDDPTLSGDLLELYFASNRGGGGLEDIYVATRAAADQAFDTPLPVAELNDPAAQDSTPELSPDGLTMTLASDRSGGVGFLDVYIATRPTRADPWTAPVHVNELSSGAGEGAPVFTADALTAVMCRLDGPTMDLRLLLATRADAGAPWTVPTELSALNADDGRDCAPWIDATGSELWWGSTRPLPDGGEDLWQVAFADGAPQGEPVEIVELNTDARDDDPWLSPDGTTIVFASTRNGTFDLFTATRDMR